MIEKQILFDKDAKEKLLTGVNAVADAVKVTLGAAGRNVAIEDERGLPHLTKDGVTVAKAITLSDPVENLGASILKEASSKSTDLAGDGTTTTAVLAQGIINRAMPQVNESTNITLLKRGMEDASKDVVEYLEKSSRKVSKKALKYVASISANNDSEIGGLISKAYSKVGINGEVTMEESLDGRTYVEITDGVKIRKGYTSPYLITDQEKQECVLDEPLVFISDQKIDSIDEIEEVLKAAIQNKRSLLIISDIDDRVMNVLNINKAKGVIKVNVVSPEGIGIKRFELLEDLCALTGSILASDETGNDLSAVDGTFLGQAKKCISSSTKTILIVDKAENKEAIDGRVKSVKDSILESENKHNLWHYKDRLGRLSGGVAVIRVGAKSEVEMKEKKDRVDDAIKATKAALEEGIIAGGGVALAQFKEPSRANDYSDSYELGYQSVVESLKDPYFQILKNASILDFGISNTEDRGINVITGLVVDMFEAGIIDSTKVARNAVENSVSVASLLMTTEVTITNKRA